MNWRIGKDKLDMLDMLLSSIINSPSDCARVSREVEKNDSINKINISFLSSYTSEVLNPYIVVELAKNGYKGSLYFAPFNQFEQEIHLGYCLGHLFH